MHGAPRIETILNGAYHNLGEAKQMRMSGEQAIAAPRARVWAALNDPEVLRQCIPGCQSLDKESDERMVAAAEIRIGPIGARFKGVVTLSDIDAPHGYTITGQGNGGIAGSAKGGAKVRLREEAGGTVIAYDVEAEVGGRMAQLGGPIIDATAKNLAGKFFAKFGEVVAGGEAPAPSAEASAAATAGTPTLAPALAPALAPGAGVAALVAVATAPAPLWGWVSALVLALLTGVALGRSLLGNPVVVLVLVLLIITAAAGYAAGRHGHTASGGRS